MWCVSEKAKATRNDCISAAARAPGRPAHRCVQPQARATRSMQEGTGLQRKRVAIAPLTVLDEVRTSASSACVNGSCFNDGLSWLCHLRAGGGWRQLSVEKTQRGESAAARRPPRPPHAPPPAARAPQAAALAVATCLERLLGRLKMLTPRRSAAQLRSYVPLSTPTQSRSSCERHASSPAVGAARPPEGISKLRGAPLGMLSSSHLLRPRHAANIEGRVFLHTAPAACRKIGLWQISQRHTMDGVRRTGA